MPSARTQSHITTITPTFTIATLVATTAWSTAIALICVDAASIDISHPLIYLVIAVASTATTVVFVCSGLDRGSSTSASSEQVKQIAEQAFETGRRVERNQRAN